MRTLSAAELLSVWERTLPQSPVQRALTLLQAACPEVPPEAWARLSIGQRDGWLFRLRDQIFGPELIGLATCPACAGQVEFTFTTTDLGMGPVAAEDVPEGEPQGEELFLSDSGLELRFRLPNSDDLAALTGRPDVASGRALLFQRCLLAAHRDDTALTAEQVPSAVLERVMERMAQADPVADVQLRLSCPWCGHQWESAFDVASFFWSEINAWARRLLHDVHSLALAYGWREPDVLALSPWRRQFYLNLVSG
jgi:hypothetical protein